MTSSGLSELKRLINEAAIHKIVLTRAVSENEGIVHSKDKKLAFSQTFIVRLFTKNAVPRLKAELAEARNELEKKRAELEGCYIHIDFGLDDASTGTFAALCRSFDALSSSQKIWDITESAKTDRAKERTTATSRVTRAQVRFGLDEVDVIRSDYKSLCLRNVSSFEIHIFPGFILTKETGSDFALMEWKDFKAEYTATSFIETDSIPDDSTIIGHTWAKANKDGSPDRRFSDNRQIPIARYGELWLKSSTGLYEAYMISNASGVADFAAALSNHRDSIARIDHIPHSDAPESIPIEEPANEPAPDIEPEDQSSKKYALDWVALAALIAVILWSSTWAWMHGRQSLAALGPKTSVAENAPAASQIAPAQLPSAYVILHVINVRAAPSVKAKIVEKMTKGARVSIFKVEGLWSQIGVKSPIGWSLSKFLSPSAVSTHNISTQ